ncbi:hypothetical protein BIV23_02065 [Streptomyces monashensis]|uniref:Uncharacterized protein n=1 Tax=Streptomyces monashensis TaxID=1678012 RepID=A0A1S2QNV7_9ACTN|nr:hypothetical protein BIV23_02065 [Streptomyces monashensis]
MNLRTSCRNQAHGVMAEQGVVVPMSDLFGAGGAALLDGLPLPADHAARVRALRAVTDTLDQQLTLLNREMVPRLTDDVGYHAIQKIGGIGPALTAVFVTEDPQLGKAVPYGIYDLAANTGWVDVGTDHDTAAFAVASIRRWCPKARRRRWTRAGT